MTQTIHIMTRGQDQDYTFLLVPPTTTWWTTYNQKETVTKFENPTCILERLDHQWRLYLSGIPSPRRDPSARVIRYTLVLEDKDPQGPGTLTTQQVFNLIQTWLQEVVQAAGQVPAQSQVGTYLDQSLDVERLLRDQDQTADVLTTALSQLPLITEPAPRISNSTSPWWGSLQNHQSREEWLWQVHQLLNGSRVGRAYFLNLISASQAVPFLQSQQKELNTSQALALLIRSENASPQPIETGALNKMLAGFGLNQILLIVAASLLIASLIYLFISIILPQLTPSEAPLNTFEVLQLSTPSVKILRPLSQWMLIH